MLSDDAEFALDDLADSFDDLLNTVSDRDKYTLGFGGSGGGIGILESFSCSSSMKKPTILLLEAASLLGSYNSLSALPGKQFSDEERFMLDDEGGGAGDGDDDDGK